VHGWLEWARPVVCVVTDGSGAAGRSRLDATEGVLQRAGASTGPLFGRLPDRAVYEALLAGDTSLFRRLAAELATALADVDYVVGDAAEGYNPTHDVCRLLIDAAVERVGRVRGRRPASYAFPLTGAPAAGLPDGSERVQLTLDDAALARKLAAARGYSALTDEVDVALVRLGVEAFRIEPFAPGEGGDGLGSGPPPYYERHGERRVAEGVYARVVRFREHVLPVARALRSAQ